jgi:intraflagellar transport protein 140
MFSTCGTIALATMFATESGLHFHGVQPLSPTVQPVALHPPSVFVAGGASTGGDPVTDVPLACFAGFDNLEAALVDASLEFMAQMAAGNADAAVSAVRSVKDPRVWSAMAAVSVRSGRLEVLELCLSNMEHLSAARALREQLGRGPEKRAVVGAVAVQLGLIDDAIAAFKAARAWRPLCNLYQALDRWEYAIQIAEEHDRVRLRAVHCSYARHLEAQVQLPPYEQILQLLREPITERKYEPVSACHISYTQTIR